MSDTRIPTWTLGDRLRKAREFVGLTQEQLADRMGVSRKTVSNGEAGGHTPHPLTLSAWAAACEVSLAWLLDDDSTVTDGYLPIPGQIQLLAA